MRDVVAYEKRGDIALLAVDNPPVNAIGRAVRDGLMRGIERAEQEGAKLLLIYAQGRTWCAGADVKEFGKTPKQPLLPDICTHMEASPLIIVSAIHGTALGGGLELALATDYRIALSRARLGLPEVTLGLIPGAGGTQRLPRLVGFDKAIDMITTGRPLAAGAALDHGLVDRVVEQGHPKEFGLAFAQELLESGAPKRPVNAMPVPATVDFDAAKAAVEKKARGQLSPVGAIGAIRNATTMPFKEAMAEERRLFLDLIKTDQCQALRHAFFAERDVAKLPEIKGVEPRPINQIGVVGGGTMGAGIATAALLAGLDVVLIEMSSEAAGAARKRIEDNLGGALKRGKITEQAHQNMLNSALTIATDYNALGNADVIIEAVFEDMDVKKQVFGELNKVAKAGAVLATNTSYLDVNEIAASTSWPGDVIGLHFFSPAHVMRLLEVVVADETAPDVVATGFALGKRLGKVSVRAGVCDGFIGNRILSAYRSAADHMVLDGASPFQIDKALEAFGLAMGPFAVADLAGLDIGWATRKRRAQTRDPRERVPTYADKLCEAGHFGQKTGAGHYVYDGRSKSPNPDVMMLIEAERAALGITPRDFTDDEIVNRYMAAMVNEAAKVIEDGIARRPLDVDVVLLTGYGFPRYRGGPMKWADLHGLDKVLANIERFAETDSYFWQPAPLLKLLVGKGQLFDDLNKSEAA